MVSMKAPSAVTPGSPVKLPDGSSVTVDSTGYVSVPVAFTSVLLNGGFQLVDGVETIIPTSILAAPTPVSIVKTTVGVTDLLAAAAVARQVMIVVTVDEVYANGNGAQPTVSIGEESGSASKFAATTKFTSAAAGATFVFAGTLSANKKLQATSVAGTGTATGGMTVTVIAAAN